MSASWRRPAVALAAALALAVPATAHGRTSAVIVQVRPSPAPLLPVARNHVATLLRERARRDQAPLMRFLRAAVRRGAASDVESLWIAQQAVDRRLMALCARATDADLERPIALQRPTGPKVDLARDILAHLFVHQIHHRGQVHAMLSGTPIPPPQLDEWFLAMDRVVSEKELAEAMATPVGAAADTPGAPR